jgi:hypothetical protein
MVESCAHEAASPASETEVWGYLRDGEFRALPKPPMELAGLGPPPFDVKLPSGEERHIVAQPFEPTR